MIIRLKVRENRVGVVWLFILKTGIIVLSYFPLSFDNCLECLTVELCVSGKKYKRIGVA